jgi:flagellar motor switch protein FliG
MVKEKSEGGNKGTKNAAAAYRKVMNLPSGFLKEGVETPAAEKTGGVKKTGAVRKTGETGRAKESRYRRVAKFLILIGGGEAARILSVLDREQVEAVSREIASIRHIGAEEGAAVLEEFRSLLSGSRDAYGASAGGVEAARRLLYAAFGAGKGEALLRRTVPGVRENPFGFLEDFSPGQVSLLLGEESPAAAALILSRLPSRLSAAVLSGMAGSRKLDIVRRIANQGQVSPEVLERAAAALKEKARHTGREDAGSVRVNGMNALTAILKTGDYSFSGRLLDELEEQNPDLGRRLREKLYTLEDLIDAGKGPIGEKLRAMSDRNIAVLLLGAGIPENAGFAEKIYSCMSARRRAAIEEEIESIGAVSKKETDETVRDFLAWFRQSREEGRIVMLSDGDVLV